MPDFHIPTAEQGVIITGMIMVAAGVWLLVRAQFSRSNPIDFGTMLIDQKDGTTSLRKVGELVALLTTTWVVLYLAVKSDLTDTIFFAYVGAWVSRTVLGVLAGAKASAMTGESAPDSGLPSAIRRASK